MGKAETDSWGRYLASQCTKQSDSLLVHSGLKQTFACGIIRKRYWSVYAQKPWAQEKINETSSISELSEESLSVL
jgi:hypothetical protein